MQIFWRHFESPLPTAVNLHLLASGWRLWRFEALYTAAIYCSLISRVFLRSDVLAGLYKVKVARGLDVKLSVNLFKRDANFRALENCDYLSVFISVLSKREFIKGVAA